MEAMIQKIIEEISALPTPKEPAEIHKIFSSFPEFIPVCSDNETQESIQLLMVVQLLASTGIELEKKINDLTLHADDFVHYKQLELNLLEKQCQSKAKEMHYRQQITHCCQQILFIAGQNVELQTTELTPAITKQQLEYVKAIRKRLSEEATRKRLTDEFYALELPIAKLKLLELKEELKSLLSQLNHLAEFRSLGFKEPIADTLNSIKEMRSSLNDALQRYTDIKPQFTLLKERFEQDLCILDAQDKLIEIQNKKETIIKNIEDSKLKIQAHPLNQDIKNKLTHEFNQYSNKQELKNSYAVQIDSLLSYVDPVAWINWVANSTEYTKQQVTSSLSVEFLDLLLLQNQETEALINIDTQLEALTKISNNKEHDKKRENELIEQAHALIERAPQGTANVVFKAQQSAADYYLRLADTIILLTQKIKQHEIVIAHLDKILLITNQLAQLREKYNLSTAQDNLLPSITKLKQTIPNGAGALLAHMQIPLNQSDALMEQIKALLEQLKEELQIQESLTFDLTVVQRALENKMTLQNQNSFIEQIEALSLEKSTLQQDINQKINSILLLVKSDVPAATTNISPDGKSKEVRFVQEVGCETLITIGDKILIGEDIIDLEKKKEQEKAIEEPIVTTSVTKKQVKELSQNEIQQTEPKAEKLIAASRSMRDGNISNTGVLEVKSIIYMETVSRESDSNQTDSENRVPKPMTFTAHLDLTSQNILTADERQHDLSPKEKPPGTLDEHVKQQLECWHQEIIKSLAHYPEATQNWYKALYKTIIKAVQQQPSFYQPMHLLKDISFAFKNGLKGTVHAYQKLSPNPLEDCTALFFLKPNTPTATVQSLDALDNSTLLPLPFQKLYAQYRLLYPRYPMEAELLLQALHALLYAYQAKEKLPNNQLPQVNQDPLYEPLKRHRGFLRAWEIIEDFCRMLLGKLCGLAKEEYTAKPCFFKTNSLQLLEKTEEFINKKTFGDG